MLASSARPQGAANKCEYLSQSIQLPFRQHSACVGSKPPTSSCSKAATAALTFQSAHPLLRVLGRKPTSERPVHLEILPPPPLPRTRLRLESSGVSSTSHTPQAPCCKPTSCSFFLGTSTRAAPAPVHAQFSELTRPRRRLLRLPPNLPNSKIAPQKQGNAIAIHTCNAAVPQPARYTHKPYSFDGHIISLSSLLSLWRTQYLAAARIDPCFSRTPPGLQSLPSSFDTTHHNSIS